MTDSQVSWQARAIFVQSPVAQLHHIRHCEVEYVPRGSNPLDNCWMEPTRAECEHALEQLTAMGEVCRQTVPSLPRHQWRWKMLLCIHPSRRLFGMAPHPLPSPLPEKTPVAPRAIYFPADRATLAKQLIRAHEKCSEMQSWNSALSVGLAFASVQMQFEAVFRRFELGPIEQRSYRFDSPHLLLTPQAKLRRPDHPEEGWRHASYAAMFDSAARARQSGLTLLSLSATQVVCDLLTKNFRRSPQRQWEVFQSEFVQRLPFLREQEDCCHLLFIPVEERKTSTSSGDFSPYQ